MNALPPSCRRGERGVAALVVTVMLCFAMVLAVAVAHRNVAVEEQRSANELRAATAFEAAEAGLEWALARINDPLRIGADCRPSADPSALSFRDRFMAIGVPSGAIVPTTWIDAGTPAPLRAACVRDATGWRCSCPTSGHPDLPAPVGTATAPAFVIAFAPSSRSEVIRILADGCTRTGAGAPCAASGDAAHESTARLESAWALVPALRAAPAAALTAQGDVNVGAASLGVHNGDAASGGLALDAGGRVVAPSLRIGAPRGSPLGASIASGDVLLQALPRDRFFARHFGMGAAAWVAQPAVRRLACADRCTEAIAAAIGTGARLLAIEGDAAIVGPAAFGSAEQPVVLVMTGALRITGDVAVHGVVYADTLEWSDCTEGSAFVRGAALVGGDYRGNAGVDLRRDAAVLSRLVSATGSFARVNGSWKDF